jgi:predicted O-methyltransferase YrrM
VLADVCKRLGRKLASTARRAAGRRIELRGALIEAGLETVLATSGSARFHALEVGCMFKQDEGRSTQRIAAFLDSHRVASRFVSIDADPAHIKSARALLAGHAPATREPPDFVLGRSLECLPAVLGELRPLHFALLDGGAHPEVCLQELELALAALADGGLVLVDDLQELAPTAAYGPPRPFGKGTLILPFLVIAEYLRQRPRYLDANLGCAPASSLVTRCIGTSLVEPLAAWEYALIARGSQRLLAVARRPALQALAARLQARRIPELRISPLAPDLIASGQALD